MWALGLGMGVTCIALSLRYRVPVVTAWSTPGAAMLITSAAGVSMPEAIGAFVVCGALLTLFGFTGWFERAMQPPAAVAGVGDARRRAAALRPRRLRRDAGAVRAGARDVRRRTWSGGALLPRYAVVAALAAGIAIAAAQGLLRFDGVRLELAQPVFTTPAFSARRDRSASRCRCSSSRWRRRTSRAWRCCARPATRRRCRRSSAGPGVATLLLAPFGAYALNLAAITAAICMGREAHEDPARRYVAAVAAGVGYLVIGLFGATVGARVRGVPARTRARDRRPRVARHDRQRARHRACATSAARAGAGDVPRHGVRRQPARHRFGVLGARRRARWRSPYCGCRAVRIPATPPSR